MVARPKTRLLFGNPFASKLRRRCGPFVDYCVLLIWCLFLFGYGINSGTLYRTEALRAIIGREAFQGSWLVPTLYGEPFLTKPPGMYVAIALASLPFGDVTTASARIPSSLAATLVVFMFFAVFHHFVDRKLALISAMLMPISFMWLDKAPSAEIDMLQLAWVVSALFCFLMAFELTERGTLPRNSYASSSLATRRNAFGWWVISLLFVAIGFLTKWTAPSFYYLTIIPFLLWQGRLALLWSRHHLSALFFSASLCACWICLTARQVGWQVLHDAVSAEALQRLQTTQGFQQYPWLDSLSFPFQVLATTLPWSFFALFALRPSFFRLWNKKGRLVLQLLHCWTWPNLLFWTLPTQHHVRYCMPMSPGLVGLGVMVVIAWTGRFGSHSREILTRFEKHEPPSLPSQEGAQKLRTNGRAILVGVLIAWSIVKIIHVEVVMPNRTATRHARETAARLAELVPAGEILYLCKLKDEGIVFYYNRPARRFLPQDFASLRSCYAILNASEWDKWKEPAWFEVVERLRDQQGDLIFLVRFK